MNATQPFPGPVQEAIDQLAATARDLQATLVRDISRAYTSGSNAIGIEAESQLSRFAQRLQEWIRSPASNIHNDNATADEARAATDAIVRIVRDPLQPDAPQRAEQVLQDLVQFVDRLASGPTSQSHTTPAAREARSSAFRNTMTKRFSESELRLSKAKQPLSPAEQLAEDIRRAPRTFG